MNSIILLLIGLVVCVASAEVTQMPSIASFKCTAGVKYVENDCNNCFCANGVLACTERACVAHIKGTTRDCLKNPIVPKKGQDCWCFEDAGKFCTVVDEDR